MEIRIYQLEPPPEMEKVFEATQELAYMTDDEFEKRVGTRPINENHRDQLILEYVKTHFAEVLATVDAMVEATVEKPTRH